MCMDVIMEGRVSGMVTLGLQDYRKLYHSPWAVLPGLGGHQQIITFKCKLSGGKRWKYGNKLDISIGGVQLEKMSISY